MYKEIFGFCVRRSGHSAVLNWIAGQCEPAFWLSDIFMDGDIYKVSCTIECLENKEADMNKPSPRPNFGSITHDGYKMLIYSFEDCLHNPFTLEWIIETVDKLRSVEGPTVIFTLRNSKEVYDSQAHFGSGIPLPERNRSTEILLRQNQYCVDGSIPYNLICTDYKEWCESESYRRSISDKLGLTFSDRRRREILSHSSFQVNKDLGMATLQKRWR